MARQVRIEVLADARKYTKGMQDAQRSTQKFTDHTSQASKALKAAVGAFSVGVVVSQMRNWVAAARDSNKTAAQTVTVLKSTHGAAGLTADQFAKLAGQISKTSAVDDDLIQSGENIIATFTNIHGDVFKKTTQAAVDMTAAMNHGEVTQEGLQSSAVQLGKALNDPIKGLTALQRVGVTFSAQQKEQIADFVKHGQVAKAQGVILAEVNKEFGGSAAAAVTPAKRLAVTWGNMQEVLGNLLIPAIDRGAQILNSILGVVDRNRTAFGVLFGVLGTGAAIIGTLIVAEKIHKATTEGIAAVTKAWEGTQKGLNLVLGITKVQAATAAVAEGELAAATTVAGTAAEGAAVKQGLFSRALTGSLASLGTGGGVGLIGALPVAAAAIAGLSAVVYAATTRSRDFKTITDSETESVKRYGASVGAGLSVLKQSKQWQDAYGRSQATGAAATANATAGLDKYNDALNPIIVTTGLYNEATVNATASARLQGQAAVYVGATMKSLKPQLDASKAAIKEWGDQAQTSALEFSGSLSHETTVSTRTVLNWIKTQTSNLTTFSHDIRTLLHHGFSTDAIQTLAQKGPEYVHALATGSDKQMGIAKTLMQGRNAAISSDWKTTVNQMIAAAKAAITGPQGINKEHSKLPPAARTHEQRMQADWARHLARQTGLARQNIARTQRELNQLHSPPPVVFKIGGHGMITWTAAATAFKFKAGRMAEGGKVMQGTTPTADDVLARVSKGEVIVPAGKASQPEFAAWATQQGIPGFAGGGTVGPWMHARIGQMQRGAARADRALANAGGKALTAAANASLGSFAGAFGGGAASGNVIKLALGQAKKMRADFKVALSLIEAGIVESGLRNLPYGDRDSLGFLQQRPSQGWLHPMNISYAAWDYLRRAIPIEGRYGTAGALAQAVQRSAFPARYDMQQARALGILHAYNYDQGGVLPPGRVAINTTGRPEALGFDYDKLARALVKALREQPPRVAVDDIHQGLLRKKHTTTGGMSLGLS